VEIAVHRPLNWTYEKRVPATAHTEFSLKLGRDFTQFRLERPSEDVHLGDSRSRGFPRCIVDLACGHASRDRSHGDPDRGALGLLDAIEDTARLSHGPTSTVETNDDGDVVPQFSAVPVLADVALPIFRGIPAKAENFKRPGHTKGTGVRLWLVEKLDLLGLKVICHAL